MGVAKAGNAKLAASANRIRVRGLGFMFWREEGEGLQYFSNPGGFFASLRMTE
jgi:hypothetical protein